MKFVFNLFNQSDLGKTSLVDPMNNIAKQLEDCGHVVKWYDDALIAHEDLYMIVFDGFHESQVPLFKDFHERGGKLIIVATEEPTDNGFNHGAIKHMVGRSERFAAIAPYATAIWYLVPGSTWYEQFCPATFLDLGYSPRLIRRWDIPVEFDVGFFGSVTKRRAEMLKKFAAYGLRLHIPKFGDSEFRDREISRCKVVVQLRSYEQMGLLSSSRCSTALHLGRPVLAEPHGNPGKWPDIIRFEDIDFMAYMAEQMANNWQEEHANQMAKFMELMPASKVMAKALEILA